MKANTFLNRLILGTAMLGMAASAVAAGAESLPAATPVPYSQLNGSQYGGGQMQVREQTSTAVNRVLNLGKGRSAVVDLPVDASDVFVSNPKTSIYGGTVAAPVFADVAGFTLSELGVAPSDTSVAPALYPTTW